MRVNHGNIDKDKLSCNLKQKKKKMNDAVLQNRKIDIEF